MINIKIINGPKKFFLKCLEDESVNSSNWVKLSQIVQDQNVIRVQSDKQEQDVTLHQDNKKTIENLVIESEEYSSYNEHVLINSNVIFSKYVVENMYLHNPPDTFKDSLKNLTQENNISEKPYEYKSVTKHNIKEMNLKFEENIIGQHKSKQIILATLISLLKKTDPVVMLFYGASGLGKTETAKFIAKTLEGNESMLFRRQFSMFQNEHFSSYLFGGKHSEKSFARELLERESNVILIDEFDKVNPLFHNAFYQLFDEGIFTDRNYTVDIKKSIIICTTNYSSEDEVKKKLGDPIFSRFDACVKFTPFSTEDKRQLVTNLIEEEISQLSEVERKNIPIDKIKEASTRKVMELNNYRSINHFVKRLISLYLLDKIIDENN